MTFNPVSGGLKLIYSNWAGFTGQGSWGLASPPTASSFNCTYTVKSEKGTVSGLGTVIFTPKLNQRAQLLNLRSASVFGYEKYPSDICPFIGVIGISEYPTSQSQGNWGVSVAGFPGCPVTPF